MNANVLEAFNIMWQGMAGIFTVLIVIALIVALLGQIDRGSPKQ